MEVNMKVIKKKVKMKEMGNIIITTAKYMKVNRKNDKFNGKEKYTYIHGDIYDGEWRNI